MCYLKQREKKILRIKPYLGSFSTLGKIMRADQNQYLGYGPDSLFWALNNQPNSKDADQRNPVTVQKRYLPMVLTYGPNW